MKKNTRQYSLLDQAIMNVDLGLRTLVAQQLPTTRHNPGDALAEPPLSAQQRKHSAGLMRVNHAGEVAAQALYQGQALTAKLASIREQMQQAAQEEIEHLAWCEQRLQELNSHRSLINFIWYSGSLMIGAIAGLAGDQWSLGFVVETEKQVVKHLTKHLQELAKEDLKSRAIVEQMREDELQHALLASSAGAAELPQPIKIMMRYMSKIMTTSAYYI